MIAVDTNVLIRLLIDDSTASDQMELAKALLKKYRQVFVPQIVQVELVWVLENAYGFEKNAIIVVLQHLQKSSAYVLQQPTQFDAALENFVNHPADFSDYLILASCLEDNHQVYTFDRKFARLHSVNLLKDDGL